MNRKGIRMNIAIVENGKSGPATEYFCFGCGHLRLTYVANNSICRNCGSKNIITGKIGELDKDVLKKQYEHSQHPSNDR